MIKKLKIRFIVLAIVSLAVLLSVIVAGMNIINYRKVVSDADARIEVLEENSGRLFDARGGDMRQPFREDKDDDDDDSDNDYDYGYDLNDSYDLDDLFDMDEDDGPFFGRGGLYNLYSLNHFLSIP